MAYVTLLSIVPSLAVSFSLMTLFAPILGHGQFFNDLRSTALSKVTQGTGEEVAAIFERFMTNLDITSIGITGFLGLLISLILLLRQIELIFNKIWLVNQNRNLFVRFVYFWTFLTLGTFLLTLAVGFMASYGLSQKVIELEGVSKGYSLAKFLPGIVSGSIFFFLLYKIVPNCHVKIVPAISGALFASFLFQIASKGFGIYVHHIADYKLLYGAMAALPLFLMWIYLCWLIILLGAVLTWRLQQGFPAFEKDDRQADREPFPRDSFKNDRLQSLTPFIILVYVNQRFVEGERSGVNGQELCTKFKLPREWIFKAVEQLVELKYIVAVGEQGLDDHDFMSSRYFPTIAPNQLSVAEIFKDVLEPINYWIKQWQEEVEWDMAGLLTKINTVADRDSTSLADVLARFKEGR